MPIDLTKPPPSLSDLGISEFPEQPFDLELSELPDSATVETEIPLEEKVSKKAPSVASRVKSAAVLVFGSLFILMWSALNFWWAGIAKAVSYHNHKTLHDGIEKARIKKLLEGLELVVEGKRLGQIADVYTPGRVIGRFTPQELAANIEQLLGEGADRESASLMAKKVIQIKEKIQLLQHKGSSFFLDVASVRGEIGEVMNMQIFRDLANNPDCYAVNFLQILAVKLVATDGMETLQAYGKECLDKADLQPNSEIHPTELADLLSNYFKRPSFNVDGFGLLQEGRFLWWAAHPLKGIHALYSNTHPLSYDGSQGNPHFSGHSFDLDGKQVAFYYGAGPTGDPLFKYGLLPAYEKFGTFELRFNHQNTRDSKDHLRIKDAIEMENNQHLHAVISFDKPWAQKLCSEFSSVEDFFTKLRDYESEGLRDLDDDPKTDNGLYIPEDLFSDDQVALALEKAEEFCHKLSESNSYWWINMQDPKGRERLGRMMILVADTFLTLGMLYGSFDRITPQMIENQMNDRLDKDLFMIRNSGACKQDVDRAVVENISLRLFFRWATDATPLTGLEVCEIAGAVFGRARIVDDRNLQIRRYEILDDLLRFVGAIPNGGGVFMAHGVLKDYRDGLASFNPLNEEIAEAGVPAMPVSWFTHFKRKIFG